MVGYLLFGACATVALLLMAIWVRAARRERRRTRSREQRWDEHTIGVAERLKTPDLYAGWVQPAGDQRSGVLPVPPDSLGDRMQRQAQSSGDIRRPSPR